MTFIAPIVEGQGEQQAVKRLLGRIAEVAAPHADLRVNEPIRIKAGSFLNDTRYFEKYLKLAASKARHQTDGHVLILLDCEDDAPCVLGPRLLARAVAVSTDVGITVALAHREYETWFLAAAASLRGVEGLDADVAPPRDPEATRDAKGWLGHRMPHGYDPVSHQLPFTRRFDLRAARAVRSFDRLYRKVAALIEVP